MSYDVSQISQMLASDPLKLCHYLFPQGRVEGNEFVVGNTTGEKGRSLKVHLSGSKAGVWTDFADNEKGGDLIDLLKSVKQCSMKEAVEAAKDFLGIIDEPYIKQVKQQQYQPPKKPSQLKLPQDEMISYFAGRGIGKRTLEKYCVGEAPDEAGGAFIVFPYIEQNNTLSLIKYRSIHDKKRMFTSKNSKPCLFGWQAIDKDATEIVIVEGEIDALSFGEQGIPALSVPFGGGNGEKQQKWIDNEFENLKYFRRIYLCLDSDEQGQTATKYIVERFGYHRCYVVKLGDFKDANEVLQAGGMLQAYLDEAQTIDPVELENGESYVTKVREFIESGSVTAGDILPWSEKINGDIKLRQGEVNIWSGTNGHGKSMFLGQIIVHSLSMQNLWCVASMEFRPERLLYRMFRQACAGEPKPEHDEPLKHLARNIWVYNQQGTISAIKMLDTFKYAYHRYGVDHFLIDSLAKCGFAEDDYNSQKKFIDILTDFARKDNVQIHIVCHSRKKGTEFEESDKYDIKGTGAITDMVDNVFIVWRNKKKERIIQSENPDSDKYRSWINTPDAKLICCKQRNGDWEGSINMWYDINSYQYLANQGDFPKSYLPTIENTDEASNLYEGEYDIVPF